MDVRYFFDGLSITSVARQLVYIYFQVPIAREPCSFNQDASEREARKSTAVAHMKDTIEEKDEM